ncbi:acyl-CoA carboxylase epsilon subunit [Streptomyces sp. YIM 98790]|uniref:acyl-CoA carboxylase epsilon subunit n=1 Tax=Streptomyces sp. YIM 98790 TaxID=2689077 RepID=UPI0014081B86|nr:acyl-CoA carboxylase epsilon subunit [Streptomyces sp. YIM 98790]
MSTDPRLVRVEKGEASEEELAAVTALLLARAQAAGGADDDRAAAGRDGRSTAGWRRLERTPGFRAPHSWQG